MIDRKDGLRIWLRVGRWRGTVLNELRAGGWWTPVMVAGFGTHDFGLPYDVNGQPAGPMRSIKRLPDAMLGVKRPTGG
jgi:hypothetical protein